MSGYTGRTLGKYQLQGRLGRGGMAEVYQAYHPSLARSVAIKVLHPHLVDAPDFLGRFRREAQAVAQLHHPHIVQVFDFDVEADLHYMVMEYVEGATLKSTLDDYYLRRTQLPLDEVWRIFHALLDAVGYAHAQGMVHRDLKPANVILDSNGRPVLTDFGIARIVGGEKFTLTGVGIGTPAYMSPEQGQGQSGDARSDIYALGVMLYECLAGQVPYDADTSVAVLFKHLHAPIPSIRQTRPDLPASIEAILTQALAKNPDQRYQSADEMWAAMASVKSLSEATTNFKVAPARDTAPQPFTPFTLPRPPSTVLRLLGGLILLGLLVLGIIFVPRLAPSPAAQALAEGNKLLQAGNYQLAADAFTSALKLEPKNVPALLGRAQAYEPLGQIAEALADVEQVISFAPQNPAGYEERARLNLQYNAETDPAAALSDLDHAIELAPPPEAAHAYFLRGWAILNFPLADGAPNPQAALADLQKSAALDSQNAEAQFTLARALLATKQPDQALTAANRAVELQPNSALNLKIRAHIQFALGDFHAAIDDLAQAIECESDSTALATLYAERAYLYFQLKVRAQAQADLSQALRLAPTATIATYVQAILDPSQPHPDPVDLPRTRAIAPDDPIWQAILNESA